MYKNSVWLILNSLHCTNKENIAYLLTEIVYNYFSNCILYIKVQYLSFTESFDCPLVPLSSTHGRFVLVLVVNVVDDATRHRRRRRRRHGTDCWLVGCTITMQARKPISTQFGAGSDWWARGLRCKRSHREARHGIGDLIDPGLYRARDSIVLLVLIPISEYPFVCSLRGALPPLAINARWISSVHSLSSGSPYHN